MMRLLIAISVCAATAACTASPSADQRPVAAAPEAGSDRCALGAVSEPGDRRQGLFRQVAHSIFGDVDSANGLSNRYIDLCDPMSVHRAILKMPATEHVTARNAAIGVVRSASIQRCADYVGRLTQTDREGNLVLGGLATVFGGLGAIFQTAGTVRALSGAAGISSGLRGEFNSAFFYNQTVGSISKAIETRGKRRWTAFEAKLVADDYRQLPYPMAFAELELIHADCSLNGAFAEISDSLQRRSKVLKEEIDEINEYENALNTLITTRRNR